MKNLCNGKYKVQSLLFVCLLLVACKKDKSVKKDFVDVEFHVIVGLDNVVSFQLLNGTEQIYSESLIGENIKGNNKQYSLRLPIERTNNLIVNYGIEVNTREQGWGGWFRLVIDKKVYVDEQVITSSVLKTLTLINHCMEIN